MTVSVGDKARLLCLHNSSKPASHLKVTWWRILQGNATWSPVFWSVGKGPNGELTIPQVNKSHMALYRCLIKEDGGESKQSCGTYLRVRGECRPWLHSALGTLPLQRGSGDPARARVAGILTSWLPHTDNFLICGVGSFKWSQAFLRAGPGGQEAPRL